MRKAGFLRSPSPVWAVQPRNVSEETAALAGRALKLFQTRKRIWKANLTLVGLLLVTHVSLKLIIPGFPAAEYLATEIGALEAATLIITRRMMKKEEQLKKDFFGRIESDS
jgi:hypothetical protein